MLGFHGTLYPINGNKSLDLETPEMSSFSCRSKPGNGHPSIRSLPAELVGDIFRRYLDETPMKHKYNTFVSSLTAMEYGTVNPIILGQICSHWRNICLSMPTLWSSLAIFGPKVSHVPLILLWLERTGVCPLTLSLLETSKGDVTQTAATQQILALFVKHSQRWRSIHFYIDKFAGHELLNLTPGSTPMLESAHLYLQGWSHANADKVWRALYSSPALHRVTWEYEYKLVASASSGDVPWARLTHVSIYNLDEFDFTVDEFLGMLQPCQELLELEIAIRWPETGNVRTTPVTLPKLQVCKIDAWRYNSAVILNRVTFPRLVSLHLAHGPRREGMGQPESYAYIEDFLTRSSCNLTTFHISDATNAITEDDLGSLLESPLAQHFEDVRLNLRFVTDQIIKRLTRAVSKGNLPSLSVLSLPECRVSDGVLFRMVTSRLPVLRMISVYRAQDRSFPRDLEVLEALKEEDTLYRSLQVVKEFQYGKW